MANDKPSSFNNMKRDVNYYKKFMTEQQHLTIDDYYRFKQQGVQIYRERESKKRYEELKKKRTLEKKRLDELRRVEEEKKQEKVQATSIQNRESNDSGWTTKTMVVTAYTNGVESTGKTPNDPAYGITASGERTQRYTSLACPPSMDFGTKVYIPKMDNTYVCHDRGSAIVEGRLDIYMKHLDDARAFGKQELTVKILKE